VTALISLTACLLISGCFQGNGDTPRATDGTPHPKDFIASFEEEAQPKWAVWQEAEWQSHTHVRSNDPRYAEKADAARQDFLKIVSNPDWILRARDVDRDARRKSKKLSSIIRQAEESGDESAVQAARAKWREPTPGETSAVRAISTLARQHSRSTSDARSKIEQLNMFLMRYRSSTSPTFENVDISADTLAMQMRAETDLEKRQEMWAALMAPAGTFKPSYVQLRDLRNITATKAGWADHLDAVNSHYRISVDEIAAILAKAENGLRPTVRELHTWTRHTLADRYQTSTPKTVPVHWLDDPLGATWTSALSLPELHFSSSLEDLGIQPMMEEVAFWFIASGLDPLPASYWEKSDLYPVEEDSQYAKTQVSATWAIDGGADVRTLMTVTPFEHSWHAAHRELAYAHAMTTRAHDEDTHAVQQMLPPRAMTAALANWADFMASKPSRLVELGLLDQSALPDEQTLLLREALTWVPYASFAAGSMFNFERDVYGANMSSDQLNNHWWTLAVQHQGVSPPERRTERWGDALYNNQLVDAPGKYVDHALAALIMFHVHVNLCERLDIDPRSTNLAGRPEVAEAFRAIALAEGNENWLETVEQVAGFPLSSDAMVRYFEPIMPWLVEANMGRRHTMSKQLTEQSTR
jgi:peptidyl-dipeptidase A